MNRSDEIVGKVRTKTNKVLGARMPQTWFAEHDPQGVAFEYGQSTTNDSCTPFRATKE
jgi:hypothetical protein